jgi:SAM-dependent methyltransferase
MTLPPIFTPEYYAHWREFEARHWWTAGMRDVAAMLFEMVSLKDEGVLLDVGCGSGQGLIWFSGFRPRWRLVGIDPGEAGLRAAVHTGFDNVLLGTATTLPIATASIDAIVTLDVMQHLPLGGGDVAALNEMHRVLKPGGYLFIRTNVQAFPRVPDDPEAVWHKYEPRELATKLREAGFSVVRLSRINALLGLAEIPGEVLRKVAGKGHSSYDVVSRPVPPSGGLLSVLKRRWLRLEGSAVRAGLSLPTGRSLIALCRRD